MPFPPVNQAYLSLRRPLPRGQDCAFPVGGASFNDAELTAMTAVVDDVCGQFKQWDTPEQREFVAWLVIRLARNGCDAAVVKAATIEALLPPPPRLCS